MKHQKQASHSLLLLLAAVIWGMAFVSQSKGMDYMGPLTFNGVRALIGAAALLVYIVVSRRLAGENAPKICWPVTLRAGLLCGAALTIASTLQQYGIKYTTVGKAGFITTLYIIFVPIAGMFFRKRVAWLVWVGAGLAAVGMYLLCMTENLYLSFGDVLVLLCAIAFTAHIMIIDHYAAQTDGAIVSCIQFAVCGIVGALLYAGVLSCGVAYTLQIVGQKGVNPTVAAIIMSLESVVATVAGFVAYRIGFLTTDQSMSARQICGCVLVFAAVVLVQLPVEWFQKKNA